MGFRELQQSDLDGELPKVVKNNQRDKMAGTILARVDGLYRAYPQQSNFFLAGRVADRVRAEMGWFEQVITHAPSVGNFYEGLIRSALREIMPSSVHLGQGFVYSTHQESPSKQLDFVVYSDRDNAPLYRHDDFVVIPSSAVVAVGECKKTLYARDLKSLIERTMFTNLGTKAKGCRGCTHVNVFAFRAPQATPKLLKCIREHIISMLADLEVQTRAGGSVNLGVRNLNTVQVFFMDRGEYIDSELIWKGGIVTGIRLKIVTLGTCTDSLPEFLEELADTQRSNAERSFLTYPLKMSSYDEVIPCKVYVYKEVGMKDLLTAHPTWKEKLSKITKAHEARGLALIGVRLSAQRDDSLATTPQDLYTDPLFAEITVPLKPEAGGA